MPLQIIHDDITKVRCDAIVNAANSTLMGGGGVDGAIHAAAGPKLNKVCARLGGCPTGRAKLTRGYDLPCKYIIHTVGPIWKGGDQNEEAYLRSCYRESLALAVRKRCESVAFPLISAGSYGYPRELALQAAVSEISRFLKENELFVLLVIHDKSSFRVSRSLVEAVRGYIDDVYLEATYSSGTTVLFPAEAPFREASAEDSRSEAAPPPDLPLAYSKPAQRRPGRTQAPRSSAPSLVFDLDESFSEMLLRKIDEKGMTDAQCYKKANIDRKLFSKIRKDPQYKPSKTTAIAFAIALELPLDEARDLLEKAGFALSHSNKFDVIIEYFIRQRNYDVYEINEVLFEFDQSLLGA